MKNFKINGKTYRCVKLPEKCNNCEPCAFQEDEKSCHEAPDCSPSDKNCKVTFYYFEEVESSA